VKGKRKEKINAGIARRPLETGKCGPKSCS